MVIGITSGNLTVTKKRESKKNLFRFSLPTVSINYYTNFSCDNYDNYDSKSCDTDSYKNENSCGLIESSNSPWSECLTVI